MRGDNERGEKAIREKSLESKRCYQSGDRAEMDANSRGETMAVEIWGWTESEDWRVAESEGGAMCGLGCIFLLHSLGFDFGF